MNEVEIGRREPIENESEACYRERGRMESSVWGAHAERRAQKRRTGLDPTDIFGSGTCNALLCMACLCAIIRWKSVAIGPVSGIFHVSGSGQTAA